MPELIDLGIDTTRIASGPAKIIDLDVPDYPIDVHRVDDEDKMKKAVSDMFWQSGIHAHPKNAYSNQFMMTSRLAAEVSEKLETLKTTDEDPTNFLGWVQNAGVSLSQMPFMMMALPSMLEENPEQTLTDLVMYVPRQLNTVWKAIKPEIVARVKAGNFGEFGLGPKAPQDLDVMMDEEMLAESTAAWKEIYRDPLGPVFAGLILKSLVTAPSKIRVKRLARLEQEAGVQAAMEEMYGKFTRGETPLQLEMGRGQTMVAPGTGKLSTADIGQFAPVVEAMTESGPVKASPGKSARVQSAPIVGKSLGPGVVGQYSERPQFGARSRRVPPEERGTKVPYDIVREKQPGFAADLESHLSATPERVMSTAASSIYPEPYSVSTWRPKLTGAQASAAEIAGKGTLGPAVTVSPSGELIYHRFKARFTPTPEVVDFPRSRVELMGGENVWNKYHEPTAVHALRVLNNTNAINEGAKSINLFTRKLWTSARKRFATSSGKQFVDLLQEMERREEQIYGSLMEDLNEAGLPFQASTLRGYLARKVKGVVKQNINQWVENNAGQIADPKYGTPPAMAFFNRVADMAGERGVMVRGRNGKYRRFNKMENYVPDHVMRPEIREAINNDLRGLYQRAKELARAEDMADVVEFGRDYHVPEGRLAAMINKLEPEGGWKFGPETQQAIEHMMGRVAPKANANLRVTRGGRITAHTTGEAIGKLARSIENDHFYRGGALQNARLVNLPEGFYETDPVRIMMEYTRNAAKTLAQHEVWGGFNNPLAQEFISRIKMEEMTLRSHGITKFRVDEAALASDLLDMATGAMERIVDPGVKAAGAAYSKFTYTTKIGFGFSSLLQNTQPLISIIPDAGVLTATKAFFRTLSPTHRAYARRSGAISHNIAHRYLGIVADTGWFDKLNKINPNTAYFNFANRFLDYWSAETGQMLVQRLHKLANDGGLRSKWAQKKLQSDFGIDYKVGLNESKIVGAMRDYSHRMQLHPDITLEPLWMNDPKTRWMATLKRFSYRQAQLVKDRTLADFKRGNVFPALRMAAGGLLGAELVNWAKDKIKEFMSGRPVYNRQDNMWLRAAYNLSLIGAGGFVTEGGRVQEDFLDRQFKEAYNNLVFTATPVFAEDIARTAANVATAAGLIGKEVEGRKQDKTFMQGVGEVALQEAAALGGGFSWLASQRFESLPTRISDYRNTRSTILRRAVIAKRNGNEKLMNELMDDWNKMRNLLLSKEPEMSRDDLPLLERKHISSYIKQYYE